MNSEFYKIIAMLPEDLREKKELNGDTRLQSDLGIFGDDAIEFIERFSEKFNIDISGFDVDKYFRREGFDPFYTIKRMLKIESNLNELTISDLEKAINNKKLE